MSSSANRPGGSVASRARLGILALIAVGTLINYLDRTVLGIAAPGLRQQLGIDAAWMGIVFSAFSWTYAAAVGVASGGFISDRLLTRTGSANIARKLPIIGGLLLASTIVTANYVDDNAVVIAILSLAFFGQGMVGLGWTLISDIAPKRLMGLTGGLFNFAANLAGIVTPLVIGFIVSATGSFVGALAFVAVVALLGALSYIFILGDVRRIELD